MSGHPLRRLYRRLADWCVPAGTFAGMGRMQWKILGPERTARNVQVVVGQIEVPTSLLQDLGIDIPPGLPQWRRWPSIDEAIAMDLDRAYRRFQQGFGVDDAG